MGACDIKEAIIKTQFKNLSIIPSVIELAGAEVEIMQISYQDRDYIMTEQLKKQIDTVRDRYDYIIVDCPPALGLLTSNALVASNSVIIPVQCEFLALEGIMQLLNTIMMAQRQLNPHLEIEGVLLTMLDSRANLGFEVVEDVEGGFGMWIAVVHPYENSCSSIELPTTKEEFVQTAAKLGIEWDIDEVADYDDIY